MFPPSRQWLASSIFVLLSAVATYYMRLGAASRSCGRYFEQILEPQSFVFAGSDIVLRRRYTGQEHIDTFLSFLVAAFLPGASGLNKAFQLQQIHFLYSFTPVLAALSLESARKRNEWALISFTSIWALFYQTVGGAIIIPLWYLCFTFTTSKTTYWKQRDDISGVQAKALFLALVVGYVVPTGIMYLPFLTIEEQQLLVAFWQPCPLFVNALWWILAKILPSSKAYGDEEESKFYVTAIYLLAILVAAVIHVAVVVRCLLSNISTVGLIRVFVPWERSSWSMDEALLFIFQIDFWIILAASMVFSYISIWDLRSLSATSMSLGGGILELTSVAILLGPGAAFGLSWYWREKGMYQAAEKLKKQ